MGESERLRQIEDNVELAKQNIEANKPRGYGHSDAIVYRSDGQRDIHLWSKAYVRDVGYLLEKTARLEEENARLRKLYADLLDDYENAQEVVIGETTSDLQADLRDFAREMQERREAVATLDASRTERGSEEE